MSQQAQKLIVTMWNAYREGALPHLEQEFGSMTEHEAKVFQAAWMVGADFALGYTEFVAGQGSTGIPQGTN
jgi:hypothetical protein